MGISHSCTLGPKSYTELFTPHLEKCERERGDD